MPSTGESELSKNQRHTQYTHTACASTLKRLGGTKSISCGTFRKSGTERL